MAFSDSTSPLPANPSTVNTLSSWLGKRSLIIIFIFHWKTNSPVRQGSMWPSQRLGDRCAAGGDSQLFAVIFIKGCSVLTWAWECRVMIIQESVSIVCLVSITLVWLLGSNSHANGAWHCMCLVCICQINTVVPTLVAVVPLLEDRGCFTACLRSMGGSGSQKPKRRLLTWITTNQKL